MQNFRLILTCCGLLLPALTFAAGNAVGFGGVADNILGPVFVLSSFLGSASVIVGASCLFAAFMKYFQYRVNPLATPLSTVLLLMVLGIVLICLPLAYKLTESGIPFHLL